MKTFSSPLCSLACATTALVLAFGTPALANGAPAVPAHDFGAAFSAWQSAHGAGWRVESDTEPNGRTGDLRMLYGASLALGSAPRDEGEAASLAAAALDLTRDLHGLDASTLVLQRALFLPLG